MQFVVAARTAGITPILYLTRDEAKHGRLTEYRGNLLLDKRMDVETHYLNAPGSARVSDIVNKKRVLDAMQARREQLEAEGRQGSRGSGGQCHPYGFGAHALTLKEMIPQARAANVERRRARARVSAGGWRMTSGNAEESGTVRRKREPPNVPGKWRRVRGDRRTRSLDLDCLLCDD